MKKKLFFFTVKLQSLVFISTSNFSPDFVRLKVKEFFSTCFECSLNDLFHEQFFIFILTFSLSLTRAHTLSLSMYITLFRYHTHTHSLSLSLFHSLYHSLTRNSRNFNSLLQMGFFQTL
jgi:hypothetical protein